MDRKIIYTKFSKTRKKEVSLKTSIFQDEKGKLRVEKKGNKYSKDTIQELINTYKRIKDVSEKFEVVPIKQTDKYTVEFPFINGLSLQEQVSSATSKEEFHSLIEYYIELLNSIPTERCSLDNNFEKVFGKVEKDKEYVCLKEGILDLNLSNLIIDSKGKAHFFDYEWCYDFPIPKDFILFRALLVFYFNNMPNTFYTLYELLGKYINSKKDIKQYNWWEAYFQNKIVTKQKQNTKYILPSIDIDILGMDKTNKSLQEEISTIRIKNQEQTNLLQ